MVGGRTVFMSKSARTLTNSRITTLETEVRTFSPLSQPGVLQERTFLFQGTQFAKMAGIGDARINGTGDPSTIDEETLATVVAYATFDDIGGTGAPILIDPGGTISESFTPTSFTVLSFGSLFVPEFKIPLLDGEGRTAYYRGAYPYLDWSARLAPEVTHTKQFMLGHSLELNVPGTVSSDKRSFAYYDSHANFNISSSVSVSLWFYPTDVSQISSETWRTLLYRRIDSSNHFTILLKPSDSKIYVFVNEAGATTKLVSSAAVNLNAWNLIIFTYNPSTNALVIYLNNVSTSSTPADSYTPSYTTDANMYIGGLPSLPDIRFTGYMDNFVMWSTKILNSTEAGNMWTRGTII